MGVSTTFVRREATHSSCRYWLLPTLCGPAKHRRQAGRHEATAAHVTWNEDAELLHTAKTSFFATERKTRRDHRACMRGRVPYEDSVTSAHPLHGGAPFPLATRAGRLRSDKLLSSDGLSLVLWPFAPKCYREPTSCGGNRNTYMSKHRGRTITRGQPSRRQERHGTCGSEPDPVFYIHHTPFLCFLSSPAPPLPPKHLPQRRKKIYIPRCWSAFCGVTRQLQPGTAFNCNSRGDLVIYQVGYPQARECVPTTATERQR